MRLEAIDLLPGGGAIPPGAANARQVWGERRGLVLRLRDERGHVGLGEASPLPGYSPDTLEEAGRDLAAWGKAPREVEEEAPLVDEVRRLLADVGSAAARCAVEAALLDLLGRRLGRPARALLSDRSPVSVPLAARIGADEDPATAARRALDRGISTLKLKVGVPGAFAAELRRLGAVRRAAGDGVSLRLDANGALPLDDLELRLAQLAAWAPELIEEPVSGPRLGRLQGSPIPLAADESLQAAGAWETLAPLRRAGALRAVVLKPMALGGAFACLEIAERAAAEGIAAFVTHLFDGPLALAHAAALAHALPGEALACGLDRHPGLAAWPPAELPMLAAAEVVASDRPGLGVEREGLR